MSEGRQAKAGGRRGRSDAEPLGARRASKVKYIYRLLRPGDVSESLESKTVYVLWPDDGTWYKGRVEDCDVAAGKATIYYDETEEEEVADLTELIRDGQLAFKEPRPAGHACRREKGEIEVGERYHGRQAGDPELEDLSEGEGGGTAGAADAARAALGEDDGDGSGSESSGEDAGALEGSDSDVSFSSGELAGRKRKRGARGGGGGSSDEEVELADFEKREIMKDMSDDEKPLGWRAEEAEGKAKRAAAKGGAAAPGSARKAGAQRARAAAPPAQRRRREAAAGVAAAVQAVAAVQAAAAADPSSSDDERPASARRGGAGGTRAARRGAAAAKEDDDEAEAMRFAQSLLAKATGQKTDAAAFYGRTGSGGGGGSVERKQSMGQSEDDVRSKVRQGIQQALQLVAGEAAGAEAGAEGGALPDAAAVAEAVEAALYALFGSCSKDYKQKFRTLQFNLKDPHNPDLRAHVLRGGIAPPAFVRLSATELANKELAAYRKAKEAEALKMSVLDAEAAARFSTAAALDARDKLALPAAVVSDSGMLSVREATPERGAAADRSPSPGPSPGAAAAHGAAGGGGGGAAAGQHTQLGTVLSGQLEAVGGEGGAAGDYRVSDTADLEGAGGEEYDPETAFADDAPAAAPSKPPTTPTAAALDWASIRAAAAAEAAAGQDGGAGGGGSSSLLPPMQPLAPLDTQGSGGGGGEGREQRRSKHHHHHSHHHRRDHHSASPLELPSPHEASDQPSPRQPAEPDSPSSLRHLVLPPTDPGCLFGKGVWEGQFVVPGSGAFQLSADALAGSGDVAGLLGEREVEVKGRLALAKLDRFLSELRHSRSRTVTIGLLSPAADCSPEERAALEELVGQYTSRGRTGVAEPVPREVEAYLLPACPTADRLLAAARAAAAAQVDAALPGGAGLAPGQLLMCLVHRKDWRVPYGLSRPIRRPRVHPAPGLAAAPPGDLPPPPVLTGLDGGEPAAQRDSAPAPAVALPAGLDLSAISALAAAMGVAPAAPEQAPAAVAPPSPLAAAAAAAQPQAGLDPVQQLLSSLPPSTLVPGAGVAQQQADGAEPAAAGEPPKQRRSRWSEDGPGAGHGAAAAAVAPPMQPPQAQPPPARPGPMGPMQRMQPPPQAPQQPPPQPQVYAPPGQPQFGGPPMGGFPPQPGPPPMGAPPGPMGAWQQPAPPQQAGGMPPPPQQPPYGAGVGGPPPQQPYGYPPQQQGQQYGGPPPGQQQYGGQPYGGGRGFGGRGGPPGPYGGRGGRGPPYGGGRYEGGRGRGRGRY